MDQVAAARREEAWAFTGLPSAEVRKRILRRSFGPAESLERDTKMPFARLTPGCNVEVTSVCVDDVESWTFAFEAFGPIGMRRSMVVNSWAVLIGDVAPLTNLVRGHDVAAAYPTWLRRKREATPRQQDRTGK